MKMKMLTKTQKKRLFVVTPIILLLAYTLSYIYWRNENLSITTESVGTTSQSSVTIYDPGCSSMKTLYWPAIWLEVIINDVDMVVVD